MGKLLKFDEFGGQERKATPAPVKNIVKEETARVIETQVVESVIWPGLFESTYFTQPQKNTLKLVFKQLNVDGKQLNESMLSAMRLELPKLRQEGNQVDEEALDKLEDVMRSASSFSKYLADLLMKAWDRLLGFYNKRFESVRPEINKAMAAARKSGHDPIKGDMGKELGNLKTLVLYWLKEFPKMMSASITGIYAKEILKESLEHSSDVILALKNFKPTLNEGEHEGVWSFMNKVSERLSAVKPFNLIDDLELASKEEPQKLIDGFSRVTKDLGGPGPFDFKFIVPMVAIVKDHKGMSDPDKILKAEGVLRFLPMSHGLIATCEMLSMLIAVMEVTNQTLSHAGEVYKNR